MHQYEKLYDRIDKVFVGTPNTPSALAAKSEILENLTAKYDDLRSMGVSEDDAIDQVVDSIGDISELFGMPTKLSVKPSAGEEPTTDEVSPAKDVTPKIKLPDPYPPQRVQQGRVVKKVLIAIAVMLYVCSIIFPILTEVGLPDALGVAGMFGVWGLATAMIVGSGICLPWNNPVGKILLALGVGCYIWAFVPLFILESISEALGISTLFATWAFATVLVILSTNFKRKGLPTKEGKRIVVEPAKPEDLPPDLQSIYKPISVVLTMATLVIYLAISFWTFGWVYTWLIWVIHGCVCDIFKAVLWLIYKSGREL